VVVDPVSRIEGHLRCEVNIDSTNVIRNAVSSGTMWRGIETILKGRDPRDAWAFTQRICGVCTGVHALVSVRTVEDALNIRIPENANIIRNLMHATLFAQDHLVHFYHLHAMDWVDVPDALKADPRETSAIAQKISRWPKSSPGYFRDVQNRLKKFVESGQLGPFANGYWGNASYRLPSAVNLLAVTHYLEALDFQKDIVKVQAIFGGKNPHPNWLVGGVPCAINIDGDLAAGAPLNMERLNFVSEIIDRTITFIDQVYIPDLIAIASFYKDWLYGSGLSGKNVLAYGEFPDRANNYNPDNLLLPRGAIVDGNLAEVHPVDLRNPEEIKEYVVHSWYRYPDETKGLHPWDGITDPHYVLGKNAKGTPTNIQELDEDGKYSYIKAPRWNGHAMEVGPLARWVVGYALKKPEFKEPVDDLLGKLGLPVSALFSTLGRTAARGLEASWAAHKMRYFHDRLMANIRAGDTSTANTDKWEPSTWPRECKGVGFGEAPRGALAHWIRIREEKIDNYQAVVPTTWNASPRDPKGQIGAYEAALLNTPLSNPKEPLEILRTLHSFDPCLACSTHIMGPAGEPLHTVKVC
jgi:hydrogenase large subunit